MNDVLRWFLGAACLVGGCGGDDDMDDGTMNGAEVDSGVTGIDASDRAPDAASTADAADAAGGSVESDAAAPCSWSPLLPLVNVNSSLRDAPGSLSPDGLTLYFTESDPDPNPPESRLLVAERASTGEAFGLPSLIPGLENVRPGVEGDVEISSSGLEIVVSGRLRYIASARRFSTTEPFVFTDERIGEGTTTSISGDGLALYRTRPFDDQVERSTRSRIGAPWSPPVSVLPTGGYHGVDVSPDELRLLLTGNPGPAGPIAIAERASIDEPFGSPIPLADEILVPGAVAYYKAAWDASQTQMVVGVSLGDLAESDLYFSRCQ